MKKIYKLLISLAVIIFVAGIGYIFVSQSYADSVNQSSFSQGVAQLKELNSAYPIEEAEDEEGELCSRRLLVKGNIAGKTLHAVQTVETGIEDWTILQYETQTAAAEDYEELKKDTSLEVQTDHIYTVSDTQEREYLSWGSESVEIPAMIEHLETKGNLNDVQVAVLDTGVDYTHEYLADKIERTNFTTIGDTVDEMDDKGHGTHVTGIIADNVTDNVSILVYKVLNSSGYGTSSDIASGIYQAVADGAGVINMSLTSNTDSDSYVTAACKYAYNHNVIICCAAGNSNINVSGVYPACIASNITVAAITKDGLKASYSNYGERVDLVAPGSSIYSTLPGNQYGNMSGTSMATPFVTAAAALLLTEDKDLTPEETESALKDYGRDWYTEGSAMLKDVPAVYLYDFAINTGESCPAPVIEPAGGTYVDSVEISISCEDPEAQIYYAVDEQPNRSSNLYEGSITLDRTGTLYAVAYKTGCSRSETVSAEYTFTYTGGEAQFEVSARGVLLSYYGISSEVEVPETVDGITVTSVGAGVFQGNDWIERVVLPDTVTTLGTGAFQECKSLKSITANGVAVVDQECFRGCTAMETLTLPALTAMGKYSFAEMTALTTFEAVQLTKVGQYGFMDCVALHNLTIPAVTALDTGAFENCSSLVTFTSELVTEVYSYAFTNCMALQTAELPNAKLITSNYLFYNCIALKNVVFGASTVSLGTCCFENTLSLTALDLQSVTVLSDCCFKGSSVSSLDVSMIVTVGSEVFYECENITELDLSSATSIGQDAFSYSGYTDIVIPAVTTLDYTISTTETSLSAPSCLIVNADNCQNSDNYDFPVLDVLNAVLGTTDKTTINIPTLRSISQKVLESYPDLDTVILNNLTTIPCANFFSGIPNLKHVELNGLTTSNYGYLFAGCSNLTYVSMTSLKTVPQSAFLNCYNLTELYLSAVTTINAYAFSGCDQIESLNLSKVTTLSDYALAGCTGLKSVSFSSLTTAGNYAFAGCTALTSVTFSKLTSVPQYAFSECSALTSVSFSAATTVYAYAFLNCTSLTTASIPSATVVREGVFSGCTSLSSVTLTKMKSIYKETFLNCTSLTQLTLPSVVGIAVNALKGCDNLESLTLNSLTAVTGNYFFSELTNLKYVEMNSFSSTSYTHLFSGCSKLATVKMDQLQVMPYRCFENCTALSEISFTNLVNVSGKEGFYGCNGKYDVLNFSYVTAVNDVADLPTYFSRIILGCLQDVTGDYLNSCRSGSDIILGYYQPVSEENFDNLNAQLNYYCYPDGEAASYFDSIGWSYGVSPIILSNLPASANLGTALSISALGPGTIKYQWYSTTSGTVDSASSTLKTTGTSYTPEEKGFYYVAITSTCGDYKQTIYSRVVCYGGAVVVQNCVVEDIPDQIYTGEPIQPGVAIYSDSSKTVRLTEGTDYSVSYSDNTQIGIATVQITYLKNYSGTDAITFKIVGDLSECTLNTYPTYTQLIAGTYTPVPVFHGSEFAQHTVNGVTYSSYTLSESYTLNEGGTQFIYLVEITGLNYYTGSITYSYSGDVLSLASCRIDSLNDMTYSENAEENCPDVDLKYNGTTLRRDALYYTYSNYTAPGTAVLTVTPDSSSEAAVMFSDEISGSYQLIEAAIDVNQCVCLLSQTVFVYNGTAQAPTVVSLTYNGELLTENEDYTVQTDSITDVGTGYVSVTGIGKYLGTQKVAFSVTALDISSTAVLEAEDVIYTGNSLTPEIKVYAAASDSTLLKKGTDYTVTYRNNKNIGNGTAAVTFKGNYTGSAECSFCILGDLTQGSLEALPTYDALITGEYISVPIYCGDPVESITVDGVSYESCTVTEAYTLNQDGTQFTYTVTVTGRNYYIGSCNFSFTGDVINLEECQTDAVYNLPFSHNTEENYLAQELKYDEAVLRRDALSYQYSDCTKPGTVTLRIAADPANEASVMFAGGKTVFYHLVDQGFSIADCDYLLSAEELPYTGEPQCPALLSLSRDGQVLTEGVDYYVVSEPVTSVGTGYLYVYSMGESCYGMRVISFSVISLQDGYFVSEMPEAYKVSAQGETVTFETVVSYNGVVLTEDVDYTVTYTYSYPDIQNGTAERTVAIINSDYPEGTFTDTCILYYCDMPECEMTLKNTIYEYTGSEITPDLKITYSGIDMVTLNKLTISYYNITLFTVSYRNNVEVGIGKIVITGDNLFYGTVVIPFDIVISDGTLIDFTDGIATIQSGSYPNYTYQVVFRDCVGYKKGETGYDPYLDVNGDGCINMRDYAILYKKYAVN